MNKKYISIIVFSFFAFGNSGCGLLEEDPEHILVASNFYKTEGDAVAAVNSIYNRLYTGMYERSMQLMADLPTDDYKNGIGMDNPFLHALEFGNVTPENQFVSSTWSDHYDGINRANAAINSIPQIKMNEELKNRLLGEASFIRALLYFNLVRFYGDVPLVTQDTRDLNNLNVPRDPAEKVYQQIISDLEFAASNLPVGYSASDVGRATKGAASILLGKVYLTKKDWGKAIEVLAEVINNESIYGYGLLENFGDNWRGGTENGPEMVFSIQLMQAPGNGNVLMLSTAPRNRVPGLVGWEADVPTREVYDLFDPEDERRAATFYTSYDKDGKVYQFPWPLFFKYFDPGRVNATDQSNANIHVLRYADALLLYAEALNEQSGPSPQAYDAINRVRRRAFNDPAYDLANLNQGEFREAVYLERRKELVFEGHRWFDLVRTGRFVEVMQNHKENGGTNVQPHNVLMPVPQREIDTNPNLVQNPGY